jgi:6-phosphogluconolactonase
MTLDKRSLSERRYPAAVEVRRYGDLRELSHAAAELILDDCRRALASRDAGYTLGVSGGRTPALMLEALAELPMPWRRVHLVQVDERVAPSGSADRNFTQLTDRLLACVEIPQENVHAMPVEHEDLAAACRQYEDELHRITAGAPLDILQLGLGDDGHTASLAPGDPILGITGHTIWHVEEFNGLPRMSMTYPLINRAARILWLVAGQPKADMCRRLAASDPTIPAGRVAPENAVLLVDDEAGVGL